MPKYIAIAATCQALGDMRLTCGLCAITNTVRRVCVDPLVPYSRRPPVGLRRQHHTTSLAPVKPRRARSRQRLTESLPLVSYYYNMTKKHFIAFATYIRNLKNREYARAIADAVVAVNDNPNFKRSLFYEACGL